eukprot:jgi/Mesen1/10466/ME000082S09972
MEHFTLDTASSRSYGVQASDGPKQHIKVQKWEDLIAPHVAGAPLREVSSAAGRLVSKGHRTEELDAANHSTAGFVGAGF